MRNGFYLRLAAQNIKKNRRFYFPFMLAVMVTASIFLILSSMVISDSLPGGGNMKVFMGLGTRLVAVFCLIFLFYTNSFLIRRRKKELGLYSILGLEKRHIARVLFWETMLTALISVGAGLILGFVLNQFAFLIMLNLAHFDVSLSSQMEPLAVLDTVLWFFFVFFLLFLANLRQIRKSDPVQLLQGENVGEREPRSKWFLVVLGVLCLGVGYFLSIYVQGLQAVVLLFFVAVLLVIIGTYCLFTAGSIAVLKGLKRKKSYYYQPAHFVSVSGMLYRMKQNAAGLATICILSTMVLVLLATTVSLYTGVNDMLLYRFPTEIAITADSPDESADQAIAAAIDEAAKETGVSIGKKTSYVDMESNFLQDQDALTADVSLVGMTNLSYVVFLDPDNYMRLTGEPIALAQNEAAVFTQYGELPDNFSILGMEYKVKERLEKSPVGDLTYVAGSTYIIVIPDNGAFGEIAAAIEAATGETVEKQLFCSFDVSGSEEDAQHFAAALSEKDALSQENVICRYDKVSEFYEIYGGFLLIGIFLGFLFLMATVLIIYYKQISEGYEDRARFEIMSKVGMDQRLIRSSIKSQVLTMFSLPLLTSAVHLVFASPMLVRLLRALNLPNVHLYILCAIGVFLAFAAFYAIVYGITAKAYYNIVSTSTASSGVR